MRSSNRLAAAVERDAGYRKRKAPEDEKPSPQSESSALASLLLEWVSWGTISFPMVREAAEAACKDGADSPHLRKLASLGGPHALSRNMRRDCLNNLDITFVEPEMVKLPMMPAKGEKKVQYVDHPIILPHVLFQHLYDEHRDFFMHQIADAGPQFFWEQCPRDEPRLIDHPVRSVPDFKNRACPLVLHGDGAQYTTHHDSIKSLQWSFLGSDGVGTRTWDHVFLITVLVSRVCCQEDVHGVDTWDVVFRLVVSSFNSLLIGRMPRNSDSNEFEEEICEGKYFGFLYVVTADMEYASNVLRLEHFNSVDFCWLCDAQQAEGDLNFRNLACDAPWRSTLVDPQHAFIEDGHLIWTAAGIGRYAFVGDWLHTVHLGIMCHLLASVMDCIADTYAGNKEVRTQHLWNDLVTCHKEMGASTGERNRFPSFPFLKLAQPMPC